VPIPSVDISQAAPGLLSATWSVPTMITVETTASHEQRCPTAAAGRLGLRMNENTPC